MLDNVDKKTLLNIAADLKSITKDLLKLSETQLEKTDSQTANELVEQTARTLDIVCWLEGMVEDTETEKGS